MSRSATSYMSRSATAHEISNTVEGDTDAEESGDETLQSDTSDEETTEEAINTGDSGRPFMMSMIAMFCAAVIAVTGISSKRRRKVR